MAEIYLVEFKGSRKEYFYNTYYHSLNLSELVILQAERGEDIGTISKKVNVELNFTETQKPRSILRPASNSDLEKFDSLQKKEIENKTEILEMIKKYNLKMKIVDIEWQFDGNKMTVFFTADHRVDFRELVKELASRYKTRIELRQIGVRDEARRIGGIGICGLQQCCNTFINVFKPISTQHARDQDLPLNPSKISGNCGRLLCCLRYETETYYSVKGKFPQPGTKVKTKNGDGVITRIDIFNEEAIIRNSEGVFIRSSSEDIVNIDNADRDNSSIEKSRLDEIDEGEISTDDIKKLDDSNN